MISFQSASGTSSTHEIEDFLINIFPDPIRNIRKKVLP
jgi:hypothetical protein